VSDANPGATPLASDRLCVALDTADASGARAIARRLSGRAGWFKVGLELFVSEGPRLVEDLAAQSRIFLDLKFHDIPATVAGAAAAASRLGAAMINVHASGGREMIARAAAAAREAAATGGRTPPRLIAVTLLTSLDAAALSALPFEGSPAEIVRRLARLAREAGADGVVCSPAEIRQVRQECGTDFWTVVPGIRPHAAAAAAHAGSPDDQRRIGAPEEAVAAGADLLVIGRPITAASDPAAAADLVLASIAQGFSRRRR
jgi:orotidine-5'-phosphate decarboxylase